MHRVWTDRGDERGDVQTFSLWKLGGMPKLLFNVSFRPLDRTLYLELKKYKHK